MPNVIETRDEANVRQIDADLKNKFRWDWLDKKLMVSPAGTGKEEPLSVLVSDFVKKLDVAGNFVHAGNILATQRLLRYHPGAHVGMGTNKTLYALEDGCIRLTKEVYIPHPRSLETSQIITKLPQGTLLYKTFINVIPVTQEPTFKLVNMV